MERATRKKLAEIAREKAQMPFHGYLEDKESNIEPIIKYFPKWNIRDDFFDWIEDCTEVANSRRIDETQLSHKFSRVE